MAIYRNIHISFWTDTKVVDDFTPEDKYFMLYCLTNNYTNLCGCYEISLKQMARDTGYSEETLDSLLDRFEKVHKIIFYNRKNKELLIKNWNKYNWTKSEKLDKPLLNEIENIKTIEFKKIVADEYNKRDTVSIPYIYPMDTTVSVSVTDTVTDTNIIKEKVKRKKFIAPTLEEINQYILEKKLKVNGKQFYDYFEEGCWKDSKGNQVKNWKQKLLTWNRYADTNTKKQSYEQRDYDNLDFLYKNNVL